LAGGTACPTAAKQEGARFRLSGYFS